jgi:cysteine dioxygenase
MLDINAFATELSEIPENEFTDSTVLDFLREHPVSLASLQPYLYFSAEHYTRNLILHTPLFDLIAICWESGVLRRDPDTQFCALAPTGRYIIAADSPAEVETEHPIHLVVNPPSFASRAVTLHIYSRPFNECEIYDLKSNRYETVRLANTSEYGVLTSQLTAEKPSSFSIQALQTAPSLAPGL